MQHKEQRFLIKPREELTIFVFGDLQYGGDGFVKEAWQEFVHEFKTTPGPKTGIGLGDYGDAFRPTIMKALNTALAQDNDAKREQDSIFRDSHDKFLDKMQFLDGKLMGLHEGHHKYIFADGSTSTQRLCSALHTPYLGWMASIRVVISSRIKPIKKHSFVHTIISMHGTGSATKASTDLGWLETRIVPAFVADGYLRGHSCKSGSWSPFERAVVRRRGQPGIDYKPVKCMNVGGFSKGYTNGWRSTYVEEKGLTPQAQGYGIIRLSFVDGSKNRNRIRSEYVNRLFEPK